MLDDESMPLRNRKHVSGNGRKEDRGQSGSQPRYMQATTASHMRSKKSLTLREKIFELHDAVSRLQTNQVMAGR